MGLIGKIRDAGMRAEARQMGVSNRTIEILERLKPTFDRSFGGDPELSVGLLGDFAEAHGLSDTSGLTDEQVRHFELVARAFGESLHPEEAENKGMFGCSTCRRFYGELWLSDKPMAEQIASEVEGLPPSEEADQAVARMFKGEAFDIELEAGRFPPGPAWLNRAARVNLWEEDSDSVPRVLTRTGDLVGEMDSVLRAVHSRVVAAQEEKTSVRELRDIHQDLSDVIQGLMYWAAMNISAGFPEWAKKHGYYMDVGKPDPLAPENPLVGLLRQEIVRLEMVSMVKDPQPTPAEVFHAAANLLVTKYNALHDSATEDSDPPPWGFEAT